MIFRFICLLLFFCLYGQVESRDVTFFLATDPHYGYRQWDDNERNNKAAIDDMNQLPGTSYPEAMQQWDINEVQHPYGVVVTGDLTGSGSKYDWNGYWVMWKGWLNGFNDDYDVNGNGRLRYTVYEGYGNHDIHSGHSAVLDGIRHRNQCRVTPINVGKDGLHYSWDWEGVHFIQLNLFPGGAGDAHESLEFLKEDLEKRVGKEGNPIVIFHHYDYLWEPESWFRYEDQNRFYEVIQEYPVIAIFVGHTHWSSHHVWRGIPVFNAPTVKEKVNYFVVRIQDNTLFVHERINREWGYSWKIDF